MGPARARAQQERDGERTGGEGSVIPLGPFRLDGRVAVVTGGGMGIGRSISLLFARQGARVVVLDRDAQAAAEVAAAAATSGGDAEALTCDVTVASEVEEAFSRVDTLCGRLDILVNNAGIGHVGDLAGTNEADLDRLYEVNVKGVFLCTRAALPRLVASGSGVVLNMASIAALLGVADRFAYSMSKGAVVAMTRSVAIDYLDSGLRCNCICPARVHTPFVDSFLRQAYPGREAEMLEALARYQPVGRMAEPDEVAHLALYLCSDEAAFITGQAVPFDGGVMLV